MNAYIHPPKVRALVIGYGNPLRGDDALGLRVADALAAIPEIAIDPFVRIETVHQLTPELAETIADAELVIFIDAAAASADVAPGTLRCEKIDPASQSIETLGHQLTPSQALAYASVLFGAKPKAFVASVTAASFNYGATLSPAVKEAIPSLLQWARERIESACVPA
jgi:hydrogenase maturation protease